MKSASAKPQYAGSLTPESAASITDVEMAFSTERLLPSMEDIPDEFKRGNAYTELASAIFYGNPLPDLELEIQPGYTPEMLNRVVRSHLQSWAPKHEHKIAGVGYLISQMAALFATPSATESAA